ncbi:MAG: hypothetical protein EOM45_08890 [Clostridia bacterium]|nr:hypothetical protein [Clostridia bacterium]
MDYNITKELCIAFDKGYLDVERFALDWGYQTEYVDMVVDEIYAMATDIEALRPLANDNACTFVVSELFQSPENIRYLMKQHKNKLTAEALHVLEFWAENPWFWCYYQIKEEVYPDFWRIQDLLTEKEHIYFSPYIKGMQHHCRKKDLCCFNLMFSNGTCLQYSRTITPFLFPVSDFTYFCSTVAPVKSLKEIQSKHYPTFLLLDLNMGASPLTYKDYELGFCWQSFTIPDFSIEDVEGSWETESIGSLQRYSFAQTSVSMIDLPNAKMFLTALDIMGGSLFRDTSTGEMALLTYSLPAYTFYCALLQRDYPHLVLPDKPSASISMDLQGLIREKDLPRPWKKFEPLFRFTYTWEPYVDTCRISLSI